MSFPFFSCCDAQISLFLFKTKRRSLSQNRALEKCDRIFPFLLSDADTFLLLFIIPTDRNFYAKLISLFFFEEQSANGTMGKTFII